jgi:hypothetical protein
MNGIRSGSEIGFVTPVRIETPVWKIRAQMRDFKSLAPVMRKPLGPQNRRHAQMQTSNETD